MPKVERKVPDLKGIACFKNFIETGNMKSLNRAIVAILLKLEDEGHEATPLFDMLGDAETESSRFDDSDSKPKKK